MRTLLLLGWLLVPVIAGAYHYGPGQQKLNLDNVALALAEADSLADELAAAGDSATHRQWGVLAEQYGKALEILPTDRVKDAREIRLAKAKAQINSGGLPEAHGDLNSLVEELNNDPKADPQVLAEAQEALASAQYYMVWLMRLEGFAKEDWGPEIESARQSYKLLAEQADARSDSQAVKRHSEDLESAIRLARMDLNDLQGLPLPKQCSGCCNGSCKKPGSCKGKGKTPQKKTGPKDARGASDGPPLDGSGQ